jgi:hypothetical protein
MRCPQVETAGGRVVIVLPVRHALRRASDARRDRGCHIGARRWSREGLLRLRRQPLSLCCSARRHRRGRANQLSDSSWKGSRGSSCTTAPLSSATTKRAPSDTDLSFASSRATSRASRRASSASANTALPYRRRRSYEKNSEASTDLLVLANRLTTKQIG